MQDELDVASVLAPRVERGHGALVGSQVALSVPPFLHQRVSASATWRHNSGTLNTSAVNYTDNFNPSLLSRNVMLA